MASIGRCVAESGHYYANQMGCKIKDACTGDYMSGWYECYRTTEMLVDLQAQGRCTDCPPPPCIPAWQCEQPLNGYEADGCGNRQLNPACYSPQVGSISFTSTPPGAEIFIDGVDQNITTPAVISSVPAGDHTYTLKKAGYKDMTGMVMIVTGQTAVVSSSLTSVPVSGAGTVLLLAAGALGVALFVTRENKLQSARGMTR